MVKKRVVIIMGSKRDLDFTKSMGPLLRELGVAFNRRIASAHKTPQKVLDILKEGGGAEEEVVYITVAGRSNALSGFVDANTRYPVIACPPSSSAFGGADIYSSLRMPSGVAPLVVLDPEGAALAAAKILALGDSELSKKIAAYQRKIGEEVELSDRKVNR